MLNIQQLPHQPLWEIFTDSQTSIDIIKNGSKHNHLDEVSCIIKNINHVLNLKGTSVKIIKVKAHQVSALPCDLGNWAADLLA